MINSLSQENLRMGNAICVIFLVLSLLTPRLSECAGIQPVEANADKSFVPRYLVNFWVNGLLTAFALKTDDEDNLEDVSRPILVAAFVANSTTAVVMYRNYHSLAPFLKTLAFTGLDVVAVELAVSPIKSNNISTGLRLLNWFFVMPFVSSKVNHKIHLGKKKETEVGMNFLQPSVLTFDHRMVAGIHLLQFRW